MSNLPSKKCSHVTARDGFAAVPVDLVHGDCPWCEIERLRGLLQDIADTSLEVHERVRRHARRGLSGGGSVVETGVKEIGDTFECVLRVEITSDAPNKVDSFRRELCNLILDAPSANNADVMVTIHGASGPLPVFETNRKPSAVETKPDDEDSYIHGPGTFPHSDGCRCERCSPPKAVPDCGNPVMINAEWYGPCTLPSGHEGDCKRDQKASAPLPTCQHDLLQPNTTIDVDPADSFHAWCTVCKHDFRTRAPLKDSGARCGNWPCQLSVGHIGPCVSSPENGRANGGD